MNKYYWVREKWDKGGKLGPWKIAVTVNDEWYLDSELDIDFFEIGPEIRPPC